MTPPLQPLLLVSQSKSYCAENSYNFPVSINYAPSIAPAAENAQFEPHKP